MTTLTVFLILYATRPQGSAPPKMGLQPLAAIDHDQAIQMAGALLTQQGLGDALILGVLTSADVTAMQKTIADVEQAMSAVAMISKD